jgi:DNA helicase-2/ATP-dependent DNA helicase PcrA
MMTGLEDKPTPAYSQELNPQQLEVVTAGDGPLLVIAGAGSGKTRALTYRVAYLIESGIQPGNIMLLTFTNKAAREMLFRVESLVSFDMRALWGGTFHSVGARILRAHAELAGLDSSFTILDRRDAVDVMQTCLDEMGYTKKESLLPQGTVLTNMYSLARNTRCDVAEMLESRYPYFYDYTDEISAVFRSYQQRKQRLNVCDFDDLLCLWLGLLEDQDEIRQYYAGRFQHVLIDEYQDTNRLQSDICDLLAGEHRNIMAVGDDAQSIYSFRGADFANIMRFPERYPDAQVFKLEYNYRSSPAIVSLANQSITFNLKQFPKELQAVKDAGSHPLLIRPYSEQQQAQFVAIRIEELMHEGTSPDEIAVLYRAHYHCMELQFELGRRGIAFDVRSGIRFFEQAHVKDLVAFLKLLVNPLDEVSWDRILQMLPGIGKVTSRKLIALLCAGEPLADCRSSRVSVKVPKKARDSWETLCALMDVLCQSGQDVAPAEVVKALYDGGFAEFMRSRYSDANARADDIEQLIRFAWQYGTLIDFLTELTLMSSSEESDDAGARPRIKLTTIHQAKGLEWSTVFIIWLVEGRFPNENNIASVDEEEEERRLFYVAVTRAKDSLYLLSPQWSRDRSGSSVRMDPSRFLREISEECYETYQEDYY